MNTLFYLVACVIQQSVREGRQTLTQVHVVVLVPGLLPP